jgi:hypothetical protein
VTSGSTGGEEENTASGTSAGTASTLLLPQHPISMSAAAIRSSLTAWEDIPAHAYARPGTTRTHPRRARASPATVVRRAYGAARPDESTVRLPLCPCVPTGPPRALAPATGVVSVCARIKLRTATVLVCNLLADVVSPRPQPAGHVVCLCAHENSPGYRYGLCNLLAS